MTTRETLKTPRGQVVAIVIDGRFIRIRCRERTCPDVIEAKARGERVFHVWDIETGEKVANEYLPIKA